MADKTTPDEPAEYARYPGELPDDRARLDRHHPERSARRSGREKLARWVRAARSKSRRSWLCLAPSASDDGDGDESCRCTGNGVLCEPGQRDVDGGRRGRVGALRQHREVAGCP